MQLKAPHRQMHGNLGQRFFVLFLAYWKYNGLNQNKYIQVYIYIYMHLRERADVRKKRACFTYIYVRIYVHIYTYMCARECNLCVYIE